ncbi:MAG: TolC family protein [Proteobacteria bacterium]|nr:TolC family protein [Burkholderiales bacterium]
MEIQSSSTPSSTQPRHWGRHVCVTAWAVWLIVGFDAVAAERLSLEQALHRAEQRSQQLVAQGYAITASRELSSAAGRLPDPTLKAGVNNLPVDGPDRFSVTRDFMTMRSIGVAQEFTHGEKLQARTARFAREAEAGEAARALTLANLRRATALAWLERHYRERTHTLLQQQRIEAALQIDAAEAAYRGGRGGQADVFAARSAVARIDDSIRLVALQISIARTQLARWVGEDAAEPLPLPAGLEVISLDASEVERRLAYHPQVTLMERREAIARAEADIAQLNRRSDWSVELMYSQRGPAFSNMVSLNVSIPLQIQRASRQDRELAARLAGIEQARAEREEALRERAAETLGWVLQWQGNRDRLAHYDGTLIPLAAARTQAAIAAYRGGTAPLTAVLEGRRIEIETRLERLRLESETATLWAEVEYLIPAEYLPQRAAGAAPIEVSPR